MLGGRGGGAGGGDLHVLRHTRNERTFFIIDTHILGLFWYLPTIVKITFKL